MSCDLPAVRRAYEEQRDASEAWNQLHSKGCVTPLILAPGSIWYGKGTVRKAPPLLGRAEVRKSPLSD